MYFKDVPFPPVIRATVVGSMVGVVLVGVVVLGAGGVLLFVAAAVAVVVMVGVLLGVGPHAESVVSARSVVVRRTTGWL
ncbi:Uncharacterised protein [Dermatophilus congolensis]|uniref:Uncharacterized protein n=1 Tax=Dermatophilus congolensis TaxID=1863 RepID=A0AA46GZG4_9MICO|nr:Uncharacterised protein [Dermatophilus congolensis]